MKKPAKDALPKKQKIAGNAPWHSMLWIIVITIIFSSSALILAANAQNITTNYPKNVSGILISLRDLRREVRELGIRIIRTEEKMRALGMLSATPTSNTTQTQTQTPTQTDTQTQTQQTTTNIPTLSAQEMVVSSPITQTTDPTKEKNLALCNDQCKTAFGSCLTAGQKAAQVTGAIGDDTKCKDYYEKECKPLCLDWYFYPTPTKPPIPPVESAAQTCLLKCRTEQLTCLAAAGKDQTKINYCESADKKCRSTCPAYNEGSKY